MGPTRDNPEPDLLDTLTTVYITLHFIDLIKCGLTAPYRCTKSYRVIPPSKESREEANLT